MRRAYWILLQLYPRRYRLEFAEEMLGVFTRVAEERKSEGRLAYARFFAEECAGLLGGALRETPNRMGLVAPLGGLAVAAISYGSFYLVLSKIHSKTSAVVEHSALNGGNEQAKLLLLATAIVLWVLFFLLLSMRLAPLRR